MDPTPEGILLSVPEWGERSFGLETRRSQRNRFPFMYSSRTHEVLRHGTMGTFGPVTVMRGENGSKDRSVYSPLPTRA